MKRTRPDDDGRALTMTPERLARRIDALAIDVVKVQHALRGLAAFLDREPIELDHDTLRTVASRLVDLGTKVRVGSTPIVAHRDESIERPTLPLFDGITSEANTDAIETPKPKRSRKAKVQSQTEEIEASKTKRSRKPKGVPRTDEIEAGITPGWRGVSLMELVEGQFADDDQAVEWAERIRERLGLQVHQEPTIGHVIGWTRGGKLELDGLIPRGADGTLMHLCDGLLAYRSQDKVFAAEVPAEWYNRDGEEEEDTDGQAGDHGPGRDRPDGVAGDLQPGSEGEGPDVGETDGPTVDANAWRSVPLARILPESLADALKHEWEIETLDDLRQALSNGDSLEYLVIRPDWTSAIREAVEKLRAELGWGPEDGISKRWLEPKDADDDLAGQRPVFSCRGCGESFLLEKVKGDISHVCDGCRPDFYSEWLDRLRIAIADRLEVGVEALPEVPDKLAQHAFRLPLSPGLAAPTIIADLEWTAEKLHEAPPAPAEPFDFCSLHDGVKPGREVDVTLNLACGLIPEPVRVRLKGEGATDGEIKDSLSQSWGSPADRNSPQRAFMGGYFTRGGNKPVLWVGDPTPKGEGDNKSKAAEWAKPTLQGPALINRVRKLLDIPQPAKAPKPASRKKGTANAHA